MSDKAIERERLAMVASLILGEAQIFGHRVELAWPDGHPDLTDDELRSLALRWKAENER